MREQSFRTNAEEIVDETVEDIKREITLFIEGKTKIKIDSRGIYHDYSGIGLLLYWVLTQPGVKGIEIYTDLALANDDSVLDAICRHLRDLLVPASNIEQPQSLKESLAKILEERGQDMGINVCRSDGSTEREIQIP
jgi:hypothetical protein